MVLCGISPSFPGLSPALGLVTYVLLTRPPLSYYSVLLLPNNSVRLACVKHAASVRSEPGSNSHLILFTQNTSTIRYAPFLVFKERVSNIAELFYFCQGELEANLKKTTP